MAKRLIVMLMLLSAIVGGLGFLKFRQIQVAKAEGASFQSPSTAVTTVIAQRETWPSTLFDFDGDRNSSRDPGSYREC